MQLTHQMELIRRLVSLEDSFNNKIKRLSSTCEEFKFVAGMTRPFVSAKRLIRYFSNFRKLVEHHAQSPVREVKMLAVWPSIAEGLPTARSGVIYNKIVKYL